MPGRRRESTGISRQPLGSVDPNALAIRTRGGREARGKATKGEAAWRQSTPGRITNHAKVSNLTYNRAYAVTWPPHYCCCDFPYCLREYYC